MVTSSSNWDPKTLALFVAAGSAAMALYSAYLWFRAKGTWSWRPVEGLVTQSTTEVWHVYRRGTLWRRKVPIYRPDITYVYTVAGVAYEGKRIFFGDGMFHDSYEHVAAILGRYPQGGTVRVYCSSTSPKQSVLERGQQKGTLRHLVVAAQLLGVALLVRVLSPFFLE